jgi:apolipoprotein N-acyltransferase
MPWWGWVLAYGGLSVVLLAIWIALVTAHRAWAYRRYRRRRGGLVRLDFQKRQRLP